MANENIESVVTSTIQQVLGVGGEDLARFAPTIVALLKTLSGNDRAFSGLWSTSQTASGVWWGNVNSQLSQMATSVSNAYANQRMHAFFDTLERNLHSQQAYIEQNNLAGLSPAAQQSRYDQYIENQVQGRLRMPFVGTVYGLANKAFNIGDAYETARGLSSIAVSTAAWRAREGWVAEGLAGGRALANGLLGEGPFDRAAWGGMPSSDVTQVAAELARNIDFLAGYDGDKDKLNASVDNFRNTVRQYTRALSALKDVFGDDVSKMINVIQGMTGQSMAQMSETRVRDLSERVSWMVSSGQISLNELVSLTGGMEARMAQMPNLSPYNYLSAPQQALAAKATMSGSFISPNMKLADWNEQSQYFISQTANSKASDLFAKAFAIWVNRPGAGGDLTSDEFKRLVRERARAYNGDLRRAALDVAGTDLAHINRGVAYDSYRQAIETGELGDLAMEGVVQFNIDRGARWLLTDPGFIQEVGGGSRDTALQRYHEAIDLIRRSPDSVLWGKEQLMERTRMAGAQADQTYAMMNLMRGHPELSKVMNRIGQLRNRQEAMASLAIARNRRRALSTLNERVLSATGLASLVEGGFTWDKLKEQLSLNTLVGLQGTDFDYLEAMYQAGLEATNRTENADDIDDLNKRRETFSRLMGYLTSAEGMSNAGVQDTLKQYQATEDPEVRERLSSRLAAYAFANPAQIDELYALYGEDSRHLVDRELSIALEKKGQAGLGAKVQELLLDKKVEGLASTDGLTARELNANVLLRQIKEKSRDSAGRLDLSLLSQNIAAAEASAAADKSVSDAQKSQYRVLAQALQEVNGTSGDRNYSRDIFQLLHNVLGKLALWLGKQGV